MKMHKYTVHCRIRLTKDIIVEANNEDEAYELAEQIFINTDPCDMEYADDDYDIINKE